MAWSLRFHLSAHLDRLSGRSVVGPVRCRDGQLSSVGCGRDGRVGQSRPLEQIFFSRTMTMTMLGAIIFDLTLVLLLAGGFS